MLELMEKGYPTECNDYDWEELKKVHLNCAVFDIKNGTILKLAEEDGVVAHAVRGF
jgi:hypothetical protein